MRRTTGGLLQLGGPLSKPGAKFLVHSHSFLPGEGFIGGPRMVLMDFPSTHEHMNFAAQLSPLSCLAL